MEMRKALLFVVISNCDGRLPATKKPLTIQGFGNSESAFYAPFTFSREILRCLNWLGVVRCEESGRQFAMERNYAYGVSAT